ncbi:MAG: antitoxin component YwqK of YwqJK toxin-antitoxin module [Crocinitomicaceae bacterium]|jgi:antitoxin component YwqK of YwqJK toxin-antitoxin module
MFKKLLLFCCIIAFSSSTLAQNIEADSVRRMLILPLLPSQAVIDPIINPYPITTPITIDPSMYAGITYSGSSLAWWPLCGEKRYDNGNLRHRIPCVNDLPHGKAAYWNEDGTISLVYIYRNGKVYLKKYYDEDGLYLIENYRYDKDGNQQKHGICTGFYEDEKTTENYKMGALHGLTTITENGKIIEQEMFADDKIQWKKTWDLNGVLRSETHWQHGEVISLGLWNYDGVLTQQEYYTDGKPSGQWLRYHTTRTYPDEDRKEVTTHENGLKKTLDVYDNGVISSHIDYVNGLHTNYFGYHENGNKSFQFSYASNGIDYELWDWTIDGIETAHYSIEGDHYIGDGHYSFDRFTQIQFSAPLTTPELSALIRWTVRNGDTLKQEFLINSIGNPDQILESNMHTLYLGGKYFKHGLWKTYSGNFIQNTTTYNYGVREGRMVEYSQNNGDPIPSTIGYYANDLKTDNWTSFSDTVIEIYQYENDLKNGTYLKLKRDADTTFIRINYATTWQPYEKEVTVIETIDTLIIANYAAGKLHGSYQEFDTLSSLKVSGTYTKGTKDGYWTTYYPSGEIKFEGTYKLGERHGRWYQWAPNEKCKMKRSKLNTATDNLII